MKKVQDGSEPIGNDLIVFIYYAFLLLKKKKKCLTTHIVITPNLA